MQLFSQSIVSICMLVKFNEFWKKTSIDKIWLYHLFLPISVFQFEKIYNIRDEGQTLKAILKKFVAFNISIYVV